MQKHSDKNIYLIIPAGGVGKRMNADIPKQFIEIDKIPIIIHTLLKFDKISAINKIIIAIEPERREYMNTLMSKYNISTPVYFAGNGKERQDSVYNALTSDACSDADYVLIHDAVRPNVSEKLIEETIENVQIFGAVIPALPAKDTVKIIDEQGLVVSTPDREKVVLVQTPQAFRYSTVADAFRIALLSNQNFTDDASIAEFAGIKVKTVLGEVNNIKITNPEDLKISIL